jgi:hypothetical protein
MQKINSKKNTTESKTFRSGKPYDLFSFDEDDFAIQEMLHCEGCACIIETIQDDIPLCASCYMLRIGMFCHNCEETTLPRNFHCDKSVICDTCFSMSRAPIEQMGGVVAQIKNIDADITLKKKYNEKVKSIKTTIESYYDKIKEIKKQINKKQQSTADINLQFLEKIRAILDSSKGYLTRLIEFCGLDLAVLDQFAEELCGCNYEGVPIAKMELDDYFVVSKDKKPELDRLIKEGETLQNKLITKINYNQNRFEEKAEDASKEIKALKKSIKAINEQIDACNGDFETLENSYKNKKKEISDKSLSNTQKLLALVDSGMLTSEQIIEQFCSKKVQSPDDSSNKKKENVGITVELVLFKRFMSDFGICSEQLRELECEIQQGRDLKISDLRKTDGLGDFVKRFIVYCYEEDKNNKVKDTLNHKKKVPARKMYDTYTKNCKKLKLEPLCEKKFSEELLQILEKKGVGKKKSGVMVYTGITLQEDDNTENDDEDQDE